MKEKERKRKAEGKTRPRKRSQVQKDRKKARKAERKEAKAEREERDDEGPTPFGHRLPKNALRKWGAPIVVPTTYGMEGASAARGAYVGVDRPVDRKYWTDEYTLEGELAKGRRYQLWDGM